MKPIVSQYVYWWWLIVSGMVYAADDVVKPTGLLWQIDKVGVTPSYVFATLHSEDLQVTQLPPVVQTRFEQAKSVAIEVVMDIPRLQQFTNAMFFAGKQRLDQWADEDTFTKIVVALRQYNISAALARSMKPWAVMTTLSRPPSNTGQYLEMWLYQRAMELQIPLYGLEQIEGQLPVFEEVSLAEQVVLLKDLVTHLEDLRKLLDKMQKLYLEHDLMGLKVATENDILAYCSNKSVTAAFLKRLIDDRNLKLVKRMSPRLQEGNAFIAVGALHFAGEQGILKLLEARGYRVVAVY